MRRLKFMALQWVAAAALLTGCATYAPAAESEAGAMTPEEWLTIVVKRAAEEREAWTPEFATLMRGAALAIGPYTGRADLRQKLNEQQRSDLDGFRQFMEDRGEAMFTSWLNGESVGAEAEPLRYVLNGVAFSRYHKDVKGRSRKKDAQLTPLDEKLIAYNVAVERNGQRVLKQGYRGTGLTVDDIEALRLYAMWVDVRCCGGGVLPFHLGLTRATRLRNGRFGFKPGETAPDFTLMRMEAGFGEPGYADRNPIDRADVLTPLILREFLLNLQGYRADPERKGKVVAKPTVVPRGREDDYVTLSSFRGKKPVLLVLANPSDAFCWHWKIAPMFEPLRQAYKDKLEMLFINTTIHDTYMPMRGFYSGRRESAVHDLALWERARGCKMFYMNWPQFTATYLLDDMAQHMRNAYMDQGGGAYILLIDMDGKIAYLDYHQDVPKGLSFYDEVVYVRMNNLESRLKSFFDGGARYDKKIETPFPTWRRPPLLSNATVKAVDAAKGTLTVAARAAYGEQQHQIVIGPGTRVTVACKPAVLGDIKVGRPVTISYRRDGDRKTARWIRDFQDVPWGMHNISVIWLSGRVKEVADGRLTVAMIVPPVEQMKGLNFWREAGDRAKAYDAESQTRLRAVRRWAEGEGAKVRRFALDSAVDIFLHGHAVGADALRPGDFVGVRYYSFQDADDLIYPHQIRATRPDQAR